MELLKSTGHLFIGVTKRFYWLAPTLLADPFDIAERWFGIMYEAPSWLVWVLVSVGILIAVILTYHDLRKDNLKLLTEPKTIMQPQPRKHIDTVVWLNFIEQMNKIHGHSDDSGLRSDMKDGIDLNLIMERKCTKCGMPRKEWGY